VIHLFDAELGTTDHVDLAAVQLGHTQSWGRNRRTMAMEAIVMDMFKAKVVRYQYSDALQRHSQELSQSVYTEVSNNVMQFGESFIWPIAWKHNHTVVDLETLMKNSNRMNKAADRIFGLRHLTGWRRQFTKAQGVLGLLSRYNSTNDTTTGGTLIFHEKVPGWPELPLPGNLSVPFYAQQ